MFGEFVYDIVLLFAAKKQFSPESKNKIEPVLSHGFMKIYSVRPIPFYHSIA